MKAGSFSLILKTTITSNMRFASADRKILCLLFMSFIFLNRLLIAQKPVDAKNDVNTPLHAIKVEYPVPYEAPTIGNVKAVLDRIYNYLDAATPAQMINKK
jgi:hypothetical protein